MKVIILFLTVLFSQVTFAQEKRIDKFYSFPIKVGDEQWRKLGNTHERISALQIPIIQLDGLTTEELLDVCLESASRSESISTVGWPKGVYIVKVTVGEEELTEKVIVR